MCVAQHPPPPTSHSVVFVSDRHMPACERHTVCVAATVILIFAFCFTFS
jgi:hypothetical protein